MSVTEIRERINAAGSGQDSDSDQDSAKPLAGMSAGKSYREKAEIVLLFAFAVVLGHYFIKFMVQEVSSGLHFSNTVVQVEPAGY